MKMLLAVAVGGAVGAVARYKTIGWVTQAAGTGFPWGTAAVNVLGCLLMGILIELGAQRQLLTPELRALRSEEHTSELQSLMRISYAVFCLKKKTDETIRMKPTRN